MRIKEYLVSKKALSGVFIAFYLLTLKVTYLTLIKPIDTEPFQRVTRCKAIVVLGGDDDHDRILKGLEMAQFNHDALVIFSGVHERYQKVVKVFGLDKVVFENSSVNTFENARNTQQILKENRIDSLCLITSDAHLYRAKKVFESHGFEVIPVASYVPSSTIRLSSFLPHIKYLRMNIAVIYEYLALVEYKLRERI